MPQQAWNAKRERQYEHIKEGLRERGTSEDKAEGDRRAHGQQGAGAVGEATRVVAALDARHLLEPPRRPSLGHAPREGAHPRPAVRGGQGPGHRGSLEDEQGAAAACRGREEALRRLTAILAT